MQPVRALQSTGKSKACFTWHYAFVKNSFLFDVEKGYNTCAYLDRIAHTSDQFSEEENNQEIERAIDEIIRYDFMNIYKKVKRTKTTKEDKA